MQRICADFYFIYAVLSGDAANTNFIVFGLSRSGLEYTIYSTRNEHADATAYIVLT
jgi:hypothetical protein